MNGQQARRLRIQGTALVLIAEAAHIAWEYFHGGIVSHHLLARADLPAVSNAWGLLLLPLLTWFLMGFALSGIVNGTRVRVTTGNGGDRVDTSALPRRLTYGFAGSLLFGALLALSFALGYRSMSSLLFQGMLLLALVLRVYRPEYVLGFVLGMTITFGAVLPTVVAAMIAAVSAVAHRLLYPLAARVWLWLGQR